MIENTTKEVLVRLGFDQSKAQEYANESVTTKRIINDNHIFIDGVNRLVYSGDEGARKYYFNLDNLKFPNKAPQLIGEYYDLKETIFLEKDKESFYSTDILKGQFFDNEIKAANRNINRTKEKYPMLIKEGKFSTDTEEMYLKWLNKKQEQQTKPVNPDDVLLKNEYIKIFKNDIGFTLFEKMKGLYSDINTQQADYSFLFDIMQKDGFVICRGVKFVDFLKNFDITITKIDSSKTGNKQKAKLYKSIKEPLEKKHGLSTI
ncbi:hypothetical protein EKM02_13465 [Flavobacterium sp. RSP49]|uniref:hypothetical protein n=1 Tax=Flavobacterium sp. RSP49 TaxID=2497487 RepID=UPI000F83567A|nr:hypothetical protein [Flavobacterium sp. RSP49]RTY97608.1 hypothetical protein EKM02_13465 [Flavobacterium sp. RSP49]